MSQCSKLVYFMPDYSKDIRPIHGSILPLPPVNRVSTIK